MTPELAALATELQMSPTLNRLAEFSLSFPLDTDNPDDFKTAFITCSIPIIRGLDAGRIECAMDEDSAVLHALLTTALMLVHGGPFGESARVQ